MFDTYKGVIFVRKPTLSVLCHSKRQSSHLKQHFWKELCPESLPSCLLVVLILT